LEFWLELFFLLDHDHFGAEVGPRRLTTDLPLTNLSLSPPNGNTAHRMSESTASSSPSVAAAAPAPRERRPPIWLVGIFLALATLALYWPAIHHDFINLDDPVYVTENPHVQAGLSWQSVKWAFSHPVCSNWHPLTVMSHMADCQTFGLKPAGPHLINVLLHSLNVALVFILLYQLTGACWRSFLIAALFAAHPLHVESVAWIAERKDVLSGFFGLLTLIFYARYAAAQPVSGEGGPSRFLTQPAVNYLLALLFFIFGLLSKPMLVTWPFVMLLLDFWPLQRLELHTARRLVLEKIPFFILITLASVITFVVQKQAGSVMNTATMSLTARCVNALVSYARYLQKTFWPANLSIFYPRTGFWPLPIIIGAAFLLLAVSILLWRLRRRYPPLLMGWLWFCGTLVPVIGLVQVGDQSMADRYMYLPSLGVFIVIVWGAGGLLCRKDLNHEPECEKAGSADSLSRRNEVKTDLVRSNVTSQAGSSSSNAGAGAQAESFLHIALWSAGSVAVLLCIIVTRLQLGYWTDSETLFRHALAVTKDNAIAHEHVGVALFDKKQIDAAIPEFVEAIRLDGRYPDSFNNLGLALARKGQMDDAIRCFREGIRLQSGNPDFHYNLGIALNQKEQFDGAIAQFQETVRLQPDNPGAHLALGNDLGIMNRFDDAIVQFQEVIRLQPNNMIAHSHLGLALGKKGLAAQSISEFREAVRLAPDDFDAHSNLGDALYYQGQLDAAIDEFEAARRLKPDDDLINQKLRFTRATKERRAPH
jgi:tetratricopeptide (TPR) repeat protein